MRCTVWSTESESEMRRFVLYCLATAALAACSAPVPTEETDQAAEPVVTPPDPNIVRFLEQSSWGPNQASIDHLATALGGDLNTAFTEQLTMPQSVYTTGGNSIERQFFNFAVNGQDQLRQRVAFALSEIIVISNQKVGNADGMVAYLNLLSNSAFGNYEKLLLAITTDPAMGDYLDMANNRAFDKNGAQIAPNENYARELLQLFSIGLWQLAPDGSFTTNPPTPSYPQEVIESYAHVFTGWQYPGGTCKQGRGPAKNYLSPLVACEVNHDATPQTVLNGQILQGTAISELPTAIHGIATNANVAPFICKQLIQRLVTGNPSPGQITRCSTVWKAQQASNNQLRDVVKTILLDSEARTTPADPGYGHLREPALFMNSVLRMFSTSSGSGWPAWAANMGQDIFNSPTVFNFFPPNYYLPGTTQLAPEMAIVDSATVMARENFVEKLVYESTAGTQLVLTGLPTNAADMIAWTNGNMLHGGMSQNLSNVLTAALAGLAKVPMQKRAIYLVATSAEYQNER
jgi:hypothetical protein